ncbi:PREDICTED: aminoacylase-1-like [Dufourea novaeangliae]|uniref:N-acyl-aliphatic-L-amino acid amidohydrolase n=1 Tax=Dufourea novaeangliae TaxID=178035 RepID=A0A154PAG0_DUFNO|nr:PREDICTED: aminoacylase-1-like [Dufourea novaeangliae]KZC08889.1 Aminoacylase-1A [Dufourea novaeangliae]
MSPSSQAQLDATAVENFREYLRIPSVQPDIDYNDCVNFLRKQAKSLDLPVKVYYAHPNKPIVVLTWVGTNPMETSILLNSHMDVVPVFEEKWTYPPFSAHMDEQGNIYARGSQDMKCVGIQYLEAIRRMKLAGQQLKRTIHVSFVPDEEIGGVLGMKDFVHTKDFQDLNVGFALDEGVASPEECFYMFYGERSIWHVEIECNGTPGHGSLLLDNTAGEKIRVIIDRFMDLRTKEKKKMANPKLLPGDVTSINLTQLKGGIQTNVVPTTLSAVFDIRLDPSVDHDEFEAMIKTWCQEAGENVTYSFEQKNPKIENTKLDDSNPYWVAFKKTCDDLGITLQIGIFPGGTDSRYVREVGIPAIGFSPMNKTKILLHDHDEYLNKDTYLKGIEIYMNIIPAVADV